MLTSCPIALGKSERMCLEREGTIAIESRARLISARWQSSRWSSMVSVVLDIEKLFVYLLMAMDPRAEF